MNILSYKLYSQLLRCFNIKNILSVSNNNFLCPTKNAQIIFINRSAITRPKEIDMLRQKKQKREHKHSNEFIKNIELYGYFLLFIPIISFGLGIWQIKRYIWKLELIHDLKDKISKSPISIPENLNDLTQLNYHPIKVTGEFLYDNEFVIGPISLIINEETPSEKTKNFINSKHSNIGYNVVTPFKIEDRDLIILVNRGWLPKKYKAINERKNCQLKGTVEIIGINRISETRSQFLIHNIPKLGIWIYRDINEMAKFANTEPVFLDMIELDHTPGIPLGSQTRINLRNEHLSYIITWFALSAFTGYYWFNIFMKKRPIF